ncbi:DUF1846 domain-containing protein [Cellulosilyticum ruminicola]|uniref:DUF1846 domain-containing protein n=1 Tax=Cellulosilyticum ruminicola TaxID=425254 RepID=UPI0006D1B905|nr:DUF1846 domain-containing protein [Cellulosilyticum ruminicola]
MKIGFDNNKYLKMQSEHIRERISQFGDKLYLEFGGKLFDDYHASRVLPGFAPDSKLQMLLQLADQAEMIISINAADIEKNKVRHDLGITYDQDVLRLIEVYREKGLYVSSVVITRYTGQAALKSFEAKLENRGIKVYHHYSIEGYPNNIAHIVSDKGYGKNDYVETTRPLVVVTAPGPGSGKMATCLSQLYHENKRGVKAGYAKFETFPIWNIPLKHPVNLAYEAATADLNDVNMIDPFHLEAYGVTTVNYNRDIEIYPVLAAMFEGIYGECPYQSPTDMGVNMAGNCIIDDEVCQEASRQEIIRRYYHSMNRLRREEATKDEIYKLELLLKQAKVTTNDRPVVPVANKLAQEIGAPAAALELPDGTIVTGKTTDLLGASSAVLLNAIKTSGGIADQIHLISPDFIEPIQKVKTVYLGSKNPRLHTDEILIALSMCAATDPNARLALQQLPKLAGCQLHTSVILSSVDRQTFKKLGIEVTNEAVFEN